VNAVDTHPVERNAETGGTVMTTMRRIVHSVTASVAGVVVAVSISPAAHADADTDFAAQLHTYGIYGPKDYNAWIGKIVCQRMYNNVDHDAFQSAKFLTGNLDRQNTTEQNWQFVGAAIDFYCPDRNSALEQVADQSHPGGRA
jgi:hypothetical protein